ncbi:hypothetical protein CRM22_001977 [Opisthorchis felineus]|uniref:Small ribosomal subunit protein mS35 mitochondrial conserved domain-containing protein n=2 Tax=Opisthorchis felineus TaxID=147828 RepID=A0A4S2M865_OPIFE|nr:hypothetical protein CRM22_001977 [Opisthorchis felineus]
MVSWFSGVIRRPLSSSAFLPLEIRGLTDLQAQRAQTAPPIERMKPHHLRYGEKIDWTNIWPAPATFSYSVVPIPLRQGYSKGLVENSGVSPASYANAEIMKIPNFLHLTKSHVRKQCEALKKFCTAWPSGLNSDEVITKHYPLEIVQRTYVFSSHSIRDRRARNVTIQVPVSCLGLDEHSKRKLLRLAIGPGPGQKVAQYDWNTDILKLTSGRCPSSRQNTDYLKYVLTVLTLESRKTETWEKGQPDYDWLMFHWPSSSSREHLLKLVSEAGNQEDKAVNCKLDDNPLVREYRKALEALWLENDILRGNPWIRPPKMPRFRHNPYRLIKDPPLKPIHGADKTETLRQYADATRRLWRLDTRQNPN